MYSTPYTNQVLVMETACDQIPYDSIIDFQNMPKNVTTIGVNYKYYNQDKVWPLDSTK